MRIMREMKRSPTIAGGTAHQTHGTRVAKSGDGLSGAPRRSSLQLVARDGVQGACSTLRKPCDRWAVPSAIVDARIQLSLNVNISLIIASIAKLYRTFRLSLVRSTCSDLMGSYIPAILYIIRYCCILYVTYIVYII